MGIRRERFHLRVQQEEFMYPFHQIWPTVPSNRCHLLMTSLQFQTKMGVGPSGMISSDVKVRWVSYSGSRKLIPQLSFLLTVKTQAYICYPEYKPSLQYDGYSDKTFEVVMFGWFFMRVLIHGRLLMLNTSLPQPLWTWVHYEIFPY